jgi:hypothetical protein
MQCFLCGQHFQVYTQYIYRVLHFYTYSVPEQNTVHVWYQLPYILLYIADMGPNLAYLVLYICSHVHSVAIPVYKYIYTGKIC